LTAEERGLEKAQGVKAGSAFGGARLDAVEGASLAATGISGENVGLLPPAAALAIGLFELLFDLPLSAVGDGLTLPYVVHLNAITARSPEQQIEPDLGTERIKTPPMPEAVSGQSPAGGKDDGAGRN
jgi:hypothetical protein